MLIIQPLLVLNNIINRLDDRSICNLSGTCRYFYKLTKNIRNKRKEIVKYWFSRRNNISPDYSEYFENYTIGTIPYGVLVTLIGYRVDIGEHENTEVIGVSVDPKTIEQEKDQEDSYERNEWGQITNKTSSKNLRYIPYRKRSEEWTCIALLGKTTVRVRGDVTSSSYISPSTDGIGCRSREHTNIRVIKIIDKYEDKKGYALALCFIK